jgi:hypothetical protein
VSSEGWLPQWRQVLSTNRHEQPVEIDIGAAREGLRQRESESRVLPVTRSIGGLSVDRSRLSPHAILFSETGRDSCW